MFWDNTNDSGPDWQSARKVAGWYAVLAGAWVLASDWALARLAQGAETLHWIGAVKGLGFVLVSSVLLAVLVARHARQLRAAERAAAAQAAQYQALFDGSPLPKWVYAVSGRRLLAANDAALRLYGFSLQQMLAKTVDDLCAPAERDRMLTYLATQAATGQHGLRLAGIWRHVGAGGRLITVDVASNELPFAGVAARVVLARDVAIAQAAHAELLTGRQQLSELTRQMMQRERQLRHQLAQLLHDEVGQTLALARLQLDGMVAECRGVLAPDKLAQAEQLANNLGDVLGTVRTLLTDLRPALLEEQGLCMALAHELSRQRAVKSGVDLQLVLPPVNSRQRWPREVEYAALMVVREAVANALRHADARVIEVRLEGDAARLQLQIRDDGRGLPAPDFTQAADRLGLVGMRERCLAIQATFTITSAPGQGTDVTMRWMAPTP